MPKPLDAESEEILYSRFISNMHESLRVYIRANSDDLTSGHQCFDFGNCFLSKLFSRHLCCPLCFRMSPSNKSVQRVKPKLLKRPGPSAQPSV